MKAWLTQKIETLRTFFLSRPEREKKLLGVFGISLVLGILAISFYSLASKINHLSTDNSDHKQALMDMRAKQKPYLEAKAKNKVWLSRLENPTPLQAEYFKQVLQQLLQKERELPTIEYTDDGVKSLPNATLAHAYRLTISAIEYSPFMEYLKTLESDPLRVIQVGAMKVDTVNIFKTEQQRKFRVELRIFVYQLDKTPKKTEEKQP